jgi:hypothetical protein
MPVTTDTKPTYFVEGFVHEQNLVELLGQGKQVTPDRHLVATSMEFLDEYAFSEDLRGLACITCKPPRYRTQLS